MNRSQLARGPVNSADQLLVEHREPDNMPASVAIVWPPHPTVCSPERLSATINAAMAILARAATAYARGKPEGGCDHSEPPRADLLLSRELQNLMARLQAQITVLEARISKARDLLAWLHQQQKESPGGSSRGSRVP